MFKEIAKKIKEAKKIAIFNHTHPDGDALGSAYALKLALIGMGKQADVFLVDEDCKARERKLIYGMEKSGLSVEESDLKVALDCGDIFRIGHYGEIFVGNTAVVDHHKSHKKFSDCTVVVEDAASTTEILYDMFEFMNIEITKEIAQNLYVGLVCDSGQFKFSSTSAKTHITAAKLIECGIDVAEISKYLFETKKFGYYKTLETAIDNLELYADGKIAILYMPADEFEKNGILEEDAGDIVNMPNSLEGVEVGIYIRERGVDEYKVSFRSNAYVDVAEIADSFGGGGHIRAAGFTSREMKIETLKKKIVEQTETKL